MTEQGFSGSLTGFFSLKISFFQEKSGDFRQKALKVQNLRKKRLRVGVILDITAFL
ncbi:hypothetical protein RU94_GL001663 [Enterococcus asini]|nr:hypothetical protein RU94_GL001663 [Enterococcus asini]